MDEYSQKRQMLITLMMLGATPPKQTKPKQTKPSK